MTTPLRKRFEQLREPDLEEWPVWINCHGVDEGEPWYEDTDEECFRPRRGELPASPNEGMLLVRATVCFANGTVVPGFVTPTSDATDMGILQPQVFLPSGGPFGFWEGMFPQPEARAIIFKEFGVTPDDVFPATVTVAEDLIGVSLEVAVEGFYSVPGGPGFPPEVHR